MTGTPDLTQHERFYRPELDVLRFGAFLAVFLHHAFEYALGPAFAILGRLGAFGVDLFFLLSAYLITELLLREVSACGVVGIRDFYYRRALRIWPLYFFFLLFTATAVPLLAPGDHLPAPYWIGYLLFAGNWTTAWYGYPASVAALLWSVSMEEQFYIVWPWLLRRATHARVILVAVTMLVIAVATRAVLALMDVRHPAIWTNTFARLDPLAIGALLAVMLRTGRLGLQQSTGAAMWIVVGLALWPIAAWLGLEGPWTIIGYAVAALGCAMIFLGFRSGAASGWQWLHSPVLVYLGRISFGLYVYHSLALSMAGRLLAAMGLRSPGLGSATVVATVGLVTTIVMSAVSYRFLEAPALRLKRRFTHIESRPA